MFSFRRKIVLQIALCSLISYASLLGASTARAEIIDGVEVGLGDPKDVLPGSLNFEPPGLFAQSVPLIIWLNNKTSGLNKFQGTGVVLNVSSFSVSGLSSPYGLAWNCGSASADGSTPQLPETIRFKQAVTQVSIKVASNTNAGQVATLTSFPGQVTTSVILTSAAQTLTINAPKIKKVVLSGPCIMVASDLNFN